MIINHTELLNALIQKYGLKSYLEIGVQNPANNFDKVRLPSTSKVGVDPECDSFNILPETSDKFFEHCSRVFDLIFIDGFHEKDQVKRDFENSLRCLSDNGFIVIHDVLPENESGTIVPRETKQWWGDVYKWAMTIGEYDDIAYKTFDIDNGCMLVWKCLGNGKPVDIWPEDDWNCFKARKDHLMNVTSTVEI